MSSPAQYFIMRYRKKRGDWRMCGDKGEQIMPYSDAQRVIRCLIRQFPKQIYRLGVQV